MSVELILLLIIGLLLGGAVGFLWQGRKLTPLSAEVERATSQLAAVETEIERLKGEAQEQQRRAHELEIDRSTLTAHLEQVQSQLQSRTQELEQLRERYTALSHEHSVQQTRLQEKEQQFERERAQIKASREELTKEFENVANKIFEEKGKTFATTSQTSLDALLKPFKEQLEGFQKRTNEIHESSTRDSAKLNAEILKVMEMAQNMSRDATNLTSALKGDSQQRGAWGEAQLRRTLEMSGLVEDAHYETQSSFKDLEGKSKQTDYLIKLPDGKHIIIDSKVSLNAYDRVVSAESADEADAAMKQHVAAVKGHIDDLASKDYTNVVGMRSPSFVLMFMPIEPAYIEALKSNRSLFDYGYRKGIVLVSHTTLIPILRTVSNLWMIERSNAEAREISEKAGDIFNTVSTLAERLSKLGNTLNTAGNHYNDTVTALAGKQGLYGKVERFKTLSTKVTKALPDIEHRHIDFEDHKLQLIVEELPSEEHSQDEVLPEGSLLVAPSSDETADSESLDIPQNSEESKA